MHENQLYVFGNEFPSEGVRNKKVSHIIKFNADSEEWEEVKKHQSIKFYEYSSALQINTDWIMISGGYKVDKYS